MSSVSNSDATRLPSNRRRALIVPRETQRAIVAAVDNVKFFRPPFRIRAANPKID
jgi:hypothetical protein